MYYILKDKKPVEVEDVIKWSKWFEGKERIVRQDTLENKVFVSTVFLGIGLMLEGGKPLLFETMIFWNKEVYQERYNTWDEAVEGHEAALRFVGKVGLEKKGIIGWLLEKLKRFIGYCMERLT